MLPLWACPDCLVTEENAEWICELCTRLLGGGLEELDLSELECTRCGRLIGVGETYCAVDYKTEKRENEIDSLLIDHPTLAAAFCEGCGPGVQMIRQAMRNLPGRRE